MIEIKEENLNSKRVSKSYVLTINGKDVRVDKWWTEDEVSGEYETDYEINDTDREALTEEEVEDLEDFITDLE
jgi:hypothetical protein